MVCYQVDIMFSTLIIYMIGVRALIDVVKDNLLDLLSWADIA